MHTEEYYQPAPKNHEADACRRLWIAVLTSYLHEISITRSQSHLKAILWQIEDPYIESICDMVGVDIKKYKKAIEGRVIKRLKQLVQYKINERNFGHLKYR